jgi:hypothetical protein
MERITPHVKPGPTIWEYHGTYCHIPFPANQPCFTLSSLFSRFLRYKGLLHRSQADSPGLILTPLFVKGALTIQGNLPFKVEPLR